MFGRQAMYGDRDAEVLVAEYEAPVETTYASTLRPPADWPAIVTCARRRRSACPIDVGEGHHHNLKLHAHELNTAPVAVAATLTGSCAPTPPANPGSGGAEMANPSSAHQHS
jgi:hypothetical protein